MMYFIADGNCVYNGPPNQLVEFFTQVGHSCPSTSTPSDHLIELVSLQPSIIDEFKSSIQNGKINFNKTSKTSEAFHIEKSNINNLKTSFQTQFFVLLSRMFMQMRRNRLKVYIQIFVHIFIGLIMGVMFMGTGNDASQIIAIFKCCISSAVLIMFMYGTPPVMLFPFERYFIRTEHFNRWYDLKAYYLATIAATLPVDIILCTIYSAIVYFMTGQPREAERFIGFALITIFTALTSQGVGYIIGSIFNVTKGTVLLTLIFGVLDISVVYGMGYGDTVKPIMKFLINLSYLRQSAQGICNTVFYDREPLACDEVYCHFARPELIMRLMAMPTTHYMYQLAAIMISTLLFRIIAYFGLKCKLNEALWSKVVYHTERFVKFSN